MLPVLRLPRAAGKLASRCTPFHHDPHAHLRPPAAAWRRERADLAPACAIGRPRLPFEINVSDFLTVGIHIGYKVTAITTYDLLHRVDRIYLGPPGKTAPVKIRYTAYGVGALVFVTTTVVLRGLLSIPWSKTKPKAIDLQKAEDILEEDHFGLEKVKERIIEYLAVQARTGSLLNRQLAFDWRYTLAETDLPKVCGTTRLAGLDVAFPMLDARLVDFSLRLPADAKLKGLKLR